MDWTLIFVVILLVIPPLLLAGGLIWEYLKSARRIADIEAIEKKQGG